MKLTLFVCLLLITTGLSLAQTPITINLADALTRARTVNLNYLSAVQDSLIAAEDTKQSRAVLLPQVNSNNQYIYTQGNGTDTGRFIGANGVHEYTVLGAVEETLSQTAILEHRRAIAAEAVARAKQEVARRGIFTTVIEKYY